MWFGDLVTMRWWDDLWLNESFATWASVVAQVSATEYDNAWTTFANVEKSWAYVQDQLPSTHPIAADMVDLAAVEVNFDGITYAKGASVLKQLAAYVGFEEFLTGLRAYFAAHAFGNATLVDLLTALEETSGRNLQAWADAWLKTTGLNTISADLDVDDAGVITRFEILQSGAAPGAGERRPHRLAVGVYDRADDGQLIRTHRVELDVVDERTAVPGLVGVNRGALVLLNDDDLTYCKARLDPTSLSTVIDGIAQVTESLPRTLLWSAVWEMTRDALMRARDFVTLAVRGMATEDQIGVLQRVLAQLQVAVGSYADPAWAESTGWPLVSAALHDLAVSAPAGSDTQLAAVQAFAGAKLDAAQLAEIAGWRDGSAPLPGLTVDTDLSWTLLAALVAHGAAGDRGDRRRGGRRLDGVRYAAGDHRARAAARRREQGRGLGAADQRRRNGQRPAGRGHRRLLPPGPARTAWRRTSRSTSPRSAESGNGVPSRWPRRSRSGSTRGGQRSSGRSTWPWSGTTRSTRPPCAAWSPRAAPAPNAPCAPAPPTHCLTSLPRGSTRQPDGLVRAVGPARSKAERRCRRREKPSRLPGGALWQGAGLIGQDPDPGDQGAGDVAVGAGGHHGKHGQPGGAIADPPGRLRPGHHLDHPLSRRDRQQHGGRGVGAEARSAGSARRRRCCCRGRRGRRRTAGR